MFNVVNKKISIKDAYLSEDNKHQALDLFNQVVYMGCDFKLREQITVPYTFDEIYKLVSEALPQQGMNLQLLLGDVEKKILPYCTNFSSPYAMAFPDAGNSIAAISGALLSDFINQNLINWAPCSPVGTVIEMVVLNWLREMVGYTVRLNPKSPIDVGGIVTTGGVSSNTIAQLLSREKAFPDTMRKGVREITQDYVSIVPNGIEHYSSRLSMGWLGMGENNIIKGPTKDFKYDLPSLNKLLDDLNSQGKKVISLTAYAGDSRSMTCDNFVELRRICDRYKIWLHIDGCHGTQLLFTEKLQSKIAGINLADSVTFDPHKVMNIPYSLSILLVKNQDDLAAIQRPEDIITGEEHSFGQITPFFGSRSFSSLKLYMLIKNLGLHGLSEVIEQRCEIAQLFASKINQSNKFILINPIVEINSVIFMYCPKHALEKIKLNSSYVEILNNINVIIHSSLLSAGEAWVHNFRIPDLANIFCQDNALILRPLRFMSGNPIINEKHIDLILNRIVQIGDSLLNKYGIFKNVSEGNKMNILEAKIILESKFDSITDISLIPGGRNYVFSAKTNQQGTVVLKAYNLFARSSSSVEQWIYTQLISCNFVKPLIYSEAALDDKPAYIITKYIDGSSLRELAEDNILTETEINYITLQLVSFINNDCKKIQVQKFGRLDSNGVGQYNSWASALFKYLSSLKDRLEKAQNNITNNYLYEKLEKLINFFNAYEDVLNDTHPTLTPVDLNLSNFIVQQDKQVMYVDLESFWSADPLLAYGDFLGNTYNTSLADSFVYHWGKLPSKKQKLVHAYALLSNISALMFIHENTTQDPMIATPWGNPNSYCSLIEAHEIELETVTHARADTREEPDHFSIRNDTSRFSNTLNWTCVNNRVSEIIVKVRQFCNVEFDRTQENFYAIIYGSYAYKLAQPTSDFDILFVCDNVNQSRISRIINFIKQIHKTYGMRNDNEIPYEYKVLFSTKFVDNACSGEGIYSNDEWIFPKIIKDRNYLVSEGLLLRFLIGMLANPHIYVDGNSSAYEQHREIACRNLVKAVMHVNRVNRTSAVELLNKFCLNKDGENGDFYLGFSYQEPFKCFLSEQIEFTLNKLKAPVDYNKSGAVYEFTNEELLQRECINDIRSDNKLLKVDQLPFSMSFLRSNGGLNNQGLKSKIEIKNHNEIRVRSNSY